MKHHIFNQKQIVLKIFLWFLVVAFFLRFPFFFRDYIDKDESTFILMGQAWAAGYLPYTYLWDLKPPLTFGYFAGVISLFGNSFFWIRMGGVFLVATTAWLGYRILYATTKNNKAAWVFGSVSLMFSSLFGSVQGVMSEHISMALFMLGCWLICKEKRNALGFFISGCLFGLSAMAKLNLAYAIVLIGVFLGYDLGYKKRNFKTFWLWGLGGLLGIGITALPYFIAAEITTWWRSVFLAAGAYAKFNWKNALLLFPFLCLLCIKLYRLKRHKTSEYKRVSSLIILSFIGVLGSFVLAGKVNGHYLLQAYPLGFVLLGLVWSKNSKQRPLRIFHKKYHWAWALLILISPLETYLEYFNIYEQKKSTGSFYNGEGIMVPNYILSTGINTQNIVFFEYHIGYWLLGKHPPIMEITHPSNLFRPALFPYFSPRKTSQDALVYILDSLQPNTIVIDQKHSIFKKNPMEAQYFKNTVLTQYTKDTLIGKAVIYTKKPKE